MCFAMTIKRRFAPMGFGCALLMASASVAQAADWQGDSGGQVPNDAVVAGNESNGDPLFVCRAEFQGGVHPGKVRPAFAGCNVPWGGGENAVPEYEVLVTEYRWEPAKEGDVPGRAVPAGYEADGTVLYVCRADYNGGVHPGKIRPAFGGCNISWGGAEIAIPEYEVMVE